MIIIINITNNILADITLLVFSVALIGIMVGLYLSMVILNRKNWKSLLIFTMVVGFVCILGWMVISAGPLEMKQSQTLTTMGIGAAIVIVLCGVIYLLANKLNSVDCYVACAGCAGLFLICQHTLAGNLTTDKFLLYFSFMLFVCILAGYTPFKHYCILAMILWFEYNISGFARSYQYVEIEPNMVESIHLDEIQQQTTITGYQLIFSNIVLIMLFIMLGFIVYHKEKKNRYEYLDFQAVTIEKKTRSKLHESHSNNQHRNLFNLRKGVAILPKIEEVDGTDGPSDHSDDESLSSLSNEQRNRRLSNPSNNLNLDKAISALPQPIYRLQSNIENPNEMIDTQTSSIYNPYDTNAFGGGIFANRTRSYQMLCQTVKVSLYSLNTIKFRNTPNNNIYN